MAERKDDISFISPRDLKAAVGSGLISEAQAANLTALAHSRAGARENLAKGDEPFELFKGFNEIFIVVGLIILATGWYTATGISFFNSINNVQTYAVWVTSVSAVVLWALSEYFIRYRRMVAPAIALSILFLGNAVAGAAGYFVEPFMVAQDDYSSVPVPLAFATLSLTVFWWRFRVPFALALIAMGLFATAIVYAASRAGRVEDISDLFLLSNGGPFAWITLVLGAIVFGFAMAFDMSDPHRVTRRAANGFWLHVLAAPMLINTVALTLFESDARVALLGVLIVFALVAIIIDRRSFLITAIGYSIALSFAVFEGEDAAATIVVLGLILLLLGAFWEKIRSHLLRPLARVLPLDRLPPIYA